MSSNFVFMQYVFFCLYNSVISNLQVCFDKQNRVAAVCVGTWKVLFAQQYNLLLSKNKAICFSRHSGPPLVDSSSYFKGIGVLGSAAGRSLSFLTLLSTDFKPYKKKCFNSPCKQYFTNTEDTKNCVPGEILIEIWQQAYLQDIAKHQPAAFLSAVADRKCTARLDGGGQQGRNRKRTEVQNTKYQS